MIPQLQVPHFLNNGRGHGRNQGSQDLDWHPKKRYARSYLKKHAATNKYYIDSRVSQFFSLWFLLDVALNHFGTMWWHLDCQRETVNGGLQINFLWITLFNLIQTLWACTIFQVLYTKTT